MPIRKAPSFSSPDLQKAVTEARPALEGFDEARNRVSRDIRELEAYLQGLDLRAPFQYSLGKCFVDPGGQESQHLAASLEYSGSASGLIQEEALVWAPDKTGRFRLLYELTRWDGCVDVDGPGGPYFWDDATAERHARPLIEEKFDVRKRLYSHLPDFVKALSAHLTFE